MLANIRFRRTILVLGIAVMMIGVGRTAPVETASSLSDARIVAAMASGADSGGPCAECRDLPPGRERGECQKACRDGVGSFCGGIAAIQCPVGLVCVLAGPYVDAPGTCQLH